MFYKRVQIAKKWEKCGENSAVLNKDIFLTSYSID